MDLCVLDVKFENKIVVDWVHEMIELVWILFMVFNITQAYYMLDELILGGEIQETSKKNVLKSIQAQDLLQEVRRKNHWNYCGETFNYT